MRNITIFLISIFILAGCSSTKPPSFPGAPKWFTKRPTDDLILYGVGTALR